MATLNEIAYDLLSIVRPALSDDSDIDLRQIKFWIHNQRALFIRNELNRSRTIDADIVHIRQPSRNPSLGNIHKKSPP